MAKQISKSEVESFLKDMDVIQLSGLAELVQSLINQKFGDK